MTSRARGRVVPTTREGVPEPFRIAVPQADLVDLRHRLRMTRFGQDPGNQTGDYGFPTARLRSVVDHWLHEYDWRSSERRMNAVEQVAVTVDGANQHAFVVRGVGPSPVPLVLDHGWPWTSWDFRRVLAALADPASHGGDPYDAFDVVVPSLPGFGFSGPTTETGWNFWRTADAQVALMGVLGHERFVVSGGDIGSIVAAHMGHAHADRVLGVHTTLAAPMTTFQSVPTGQRPADALSGIDYDGTQPAATAYGPGEEEWAQWSLGPAGAGYAAIQMTRPQSLAAAMHDSPAGMAAWLLEKRLAWADCRGDPESVFTMDDLCETASIYWLTRTFGSSIRYYADAVRHPWRPRHDRRPVVEVPTAVSVFLQDVRRPARNWAERYYDLRQWRVHERGGHFAPFERPDAFVADLRDFVRPLRRTGPGPTARDHR